MKSLICKVIYAVKYQFEYRITLDWLAILFPTFY